MAPDPLSRPRARRDDVLVREVEDETLVYDMTRHRAHALNRTALLVWRHCDGERRVEEIAAAVSGEAGEKVDEALVWLALHRLARARLLEDAPAWASRSGRITRRAALRAAARAATLALPGVWSIFAPTAAAAATGCIAPGLCMGTDPTSCCNNGGMAASCSGGAGMCMGAPPPGCVCP